MRLCRPGDRRSCADDPPLTAEHDARSDQAGPFREQAYDQHLNMILGEVEETITTVEYDEDTYEEHVKVRIPLRG